MNILWIGSIDTGGMANMYAYAINKYTNHTCRVAIAHETRGFDSDIVLFRKMWDDTPDNLTFQQKIEMIRDLIDKCDVLIFNGALAPGIASNRKLVVSDTYDVKWEDINWKDYLHKKHFVFFPGSMSLRGNYEFYNDLHKDWNIITCQPDIYEMFQHLKANINYIPILVNNDKPRYQREIIKDDKVIITHSPTHDIYKNTAEFKRVCRRLQNEYNNFSVNMVENCGFKDAIKIKTNAHIGFDQMQSATVFEDQEMDYYCLSSVENCAFGLVNMVSLTDKAIKFIEEQTECELKWDIVRNEQELYNTTKKYITDLDLLFERRKEVYQWHHTQWNDAKLITKLTKILES